jgi:hypothetical protein
VGIRDARPCCNFIWPELQGELSQFLHEGGTLGQEGALGMGVFFKSGVIMMVLITTGALLGAVLGLRFTLFALVPVMFVALVLVVANAIVSGVGFVQLTFTMTMIAMAMQFGYVVGNVTRMIAASVGGRNHREASMPHSVKIPRPV